ncbi:TonB-dependent receptor [Novosphingobium malaysiense]|uniref:TonB-dependent receptor n=1 Tax=Novosphingobium malaysiense TaxID=1348853 RepID=A0A0B1ZTW9_9SPHN|nr:TonB-dependent receptor [Novosphingobium malaysiense]KHK92929.1 hypothetical protein LK12_00600 [Novosphingobium malaysiense]
MNFSTKSILLGGVASCCIGFASPAIAQDAPAQDEASKPVATNEIIVMARRRAESILKVPVVASVISGDELAQTATADLSGIATLVPGLQLGSSVSSFGNQVSLRGIGTSTNNAAIDQSVSLNIDGMQFSQGLSYAMGFFDMAHLEVLKGPQALFFGKASPAGVITIRSADPTDEFEVIGRAGYEFEAREYKGELIVSGPLTDTLKVRLAGQYSKGDGYFKNVGAAGDLGTLADLNPALAPFAALYGPLGSLGAADPTTSRVPHTRNVLLRGTVLFDPTDNLSVRFKINHGNQKSYGAGFDTQLASCPDGTAPANRAGVRFLSPTDDCKLDRYTSTVALDPAAFPGVFNDGVPFGHIKQTFGTLEINYNAAPEITISSLTGYLDLKQRYMTNGGVSSFAGPAFVVQGGYQRKDFTQELRLTSDFAGPFNFLLGAFYQDAKQVSHVDLPANQRLGELLGFLGALDIATNPTNPAYNPALFPQILANPHGFPAFPPKLSQGYHTVDSTVYSVFGQVLYKIVPDLELGVGARWTDETRWHKQVTEFPPLGLVPLAVPKINAANLSPEVSLTYTPTPDLTIFASVRQAYKSGSFITSGLFNPGEDASFHDERVRGGEVGVKSVLAGGSLNVNIAGYYYRYKGLQVGSNEISPSGNIIIYTRNAAGAKSYGIDFDAAYHPAAIDGLTISGAASWNISRFTNFTNAPCWGGQTVDQGCNLEPEPTANAGAGGYVSQDLSGHPLVRAPRWQLNGNIDYDLPLAGGKTLAMGVGGTYSSRYLTNIAGREDMYQSGYFKLNANIALRGEDDRWELALIGSNLTNKVITGNCTNGNYTDSTGRLAASVTGRGDTLYPTIPNPAGVEELTCSPDPGRTVQVRVSFKL